MIPTSLVAKEVVITSFNGVHIHDKIGIMTSLSAWAPSQYKDRLSQVFVLYLMQ